MFGIGNPFILLLFILIGNVLCDVDNPEFPLDSDPYGILSVENATESGNYTNFTEPVIAENATESGSYKNFTESDGNETFMGIYRSGRASATRHVMCAMSGKNRHTYSHCETAKGEHYKWKTGNNSPCCKLTTEAQFKKFHESCSKDDPWVGNSAGWKPCKTYCADNKVCIMVSVQFPYGFCGGGGEICWNT